jgi:hypothetical protein
MEEGGIVARTLYYIEAHGEGWEVRSDGEALRTNATRQQAMEVARQWAEANPPSQVLVQESDGTWRVELTFGNDPWARVVES